VSSGTHWEICHLAPAKSVGNGGDDAELAQPAVKISAATSRKPKWWR
jgi:hypothetical protein